MTTTETVQVHRVYIRATPEAIWGAITKPEWTVKYGYAPVVEYELRPTSAKRRRRRCLPLMSSAIVGRRGGGTETGQRRRRRW